MGLLLTLIISGLTGYLGNFLFRSSSLDVTGNIIICIFGGFIGYGLSGMLQISHSSMWVNAIRTGVAGAVVVLTSVNLAFRKK